VRHEPVGVARSAADPSKWTLRPGAHWRAWDGAAVAYSEATGNTHFVADVTAWVLEQLGKRPMTLAELDAVAAQELELPPEQNLAESLRVSLEALRGMNLLTAPAAQ